MLTTLPLVPRGRYAKDNALFIKDFTAAYTKLTELGTKGLKLVEL